MSVATESTSMKWHPAACIFPMMPDEDLAALADDIREHGQREPIIVFEDMVLDGRNRWIACRMAEVEPRIEHFRGTKTAALAFVWSLNRTRRHLNSSQAAIAEAERAKLDAVYAAELLATKPKTGRPANVTNNCHVPKADSDRQRDTQASARAEAAGTNRTYIKTADTIVDKRPDLAEKIKQGKLTIPQAKVEIKREEKRQELELAVERVRQHEDDRPRWSVLNVDVMDGLASVCDEWGPARLIFTDPPYNIGIDYGDGKEADLLASHQYMAWVRKWLSLCVDCLTDDGSLWVMIGDEYAAEYAVILKSLGLTIRNWIKWYETFGVNCSDKFNRSSRHIFYCVMDEKNYVFNPVDSVMRQSDRAAKYNDKRAPESGMKMLDDVWTHIPRLTGTSSERIPDFPTQLPLALVEPIIECASMPGDLVLDPFNGSGTTGVAALKHLRKYVGIEKSERFADLAAKRIATS